MYLETVTQRGDLRHESKFGGFNDTPPGFRLVEFAEISQRYFKIISNPTKVEYKQIRRPTLIKVKNSKTGQEDTLFDFALIYDSTGQAGIASSYCNASKETYYFEFAFQFSMPCQLIDDTGWKQTNSSLPGRGILDFVRTLSFERDLSIDEVDDLRYWLSTDNCPGWTGVGVYHLGDGKYKCTTTHDSSD